MNQRGQYRGYVGFLPSPYVKGYNCKSIIHMATRFALQVLGNHHWTSTRSLICVCIITQNMQVLLDPLCSKETLLLQQQAVGVSI